MCARKFITTFWQSSNPWHRTLLTYRAHISNIWSPTSIKWNLIFIWASIILCCACLRVWTVCCSRRGVLTQPSLSTQSIHSRWRVNTSEETVKLWLVSRGNARWLTALSTRCGEGFHLPQHSKFMLLKHLMDHLSQSLYQGHLATKPHRGLSQCFVTTWHFTTSQSGVFCRWPGLETAESICQLDHRCAGSSWAGKQNRHGWEINMGWT